MNNCSARRDSIFFIIIMFFSMGLRAWFCSEMSIYDLQHDVGAPYTNQGHLGYITYLLENSHLPDFDVRTAFQFWHPPRHHLVCAVFLVIFWMIFPEQAGNMEPVQLLSFFYITICIWLIWEMLRLWEIKGKALAVMLFYIAFHPTLVILSGSVNQDALCLLFSLAAIYFALRWYRKPGMGWILASAFAIGLGMSTKALAALAAFPMGFLFLMGLLREKDKKKILGQFVLFAVIAFPLGLWWYLRNKVLFDVPIGYVNMADISSVGYVGAVPVWDRLFEFDLNQFAFSNVYIHYEGENKAINPLICLLKTAVFGRWNHGSDVLLRSAAYGLLMVWIGFNVMSLAAVPSFLKKNSEVSFAERWAILILALVQFVSYYVFCIRYPFVWSMDVRYVIMLLFVQFLLVGVLLKKNEKLCYPAGVMSMLFALMSVGFFGRLFMFY